MVHASLFSGIGGPEVAAAMLGWDNAFHCEINPFGRAVLEYWFPKSVSYEDITKTDFTEWRGRIDVLTGGFPCQPFSYAGERRGADDERYLWPEMLRAIDEARPTWVVGENVAGLQTMVEGGILTDLGCEATLFEEGDPVHGYTLEQSFTIERICRDLEHIGYSVQPMLIPAAAVGAPHRRDRIFIIAHTERERLLQPECSKQSRFREGLFEGCGDREESAGPLTNANGGDDLRVAGGYESPCEEERLPKRNAIRVSGKPDNVRPEVQGTSSDPDLQRCNKCLAADLSSEEERQYCEEDSHWFDTVCLEPTRRWRGFPTVSPIHRGNDGIPFPVDGLAVPPIPGPPTYGKGDPQKYPFSKWRTESLKAYGNAIVPQVMYEIFRAIEQVENNTL